MTLHLMPRDGGQTLPASAYPDLLTIEQAADLLQLNVDTVYKHAQEGRIPATKFGNRWRFVKRQLLEQIEAECLTNLKPSKESNT